MVFSLMTLTILAGMNAPIYISCFSAILWIWKWLSERSLVKNISRKVTSVLAMVVAGLVFFEHRTFISQEASSTLLMGLTAIKVMDYDSRRDHLILILLGFLLLTLKPLFGMELLLFPFQIICMLTLWWALSQDPRKLPRSILSLIFMTSLPITFVLFLVFPRVVLPWALSQSPRSSARIGFATDLNPGQVAELASSDDLVFRVRMDDDSLINPEEMYWKGAELHYSQGIAWKIQKNESAAKTNSSLRDRKEESPNYELIMEPGNGTVIFALDSTVSMTAIDSKPYEISPGLWRSPNAPNKSATYMARYEKNFSSSIEPSPDDLQVPKLSPKVQSWVNQIKAKTQDPKTRLQELEGLFRENNLTYTLQPGPYGKDGMDEFLFSRRRGFCEHFAGTYATLARALGIPSRILSGYQGAEYNQLAHFWRVTQRQAHAWVEIWNGQNWQRVDPTSWASHIEFNRSAPKNNFSWFEQTVDLYEALNYRWTRLLLDFDRESQKVALREWLPRILITGLLALVFIFLAKFAWGWMSRSRVSIQRHELTDLILQIKEFEEEYQNRDLSSLPPLSILQAVATHTPQLQEFLQRTAHLYDQVFYREEIQADLVQQELQSLQKKWVEFQVLQN